MKNLNKKFLLLLMVLLPFFSNVSNAQLVSPPGNLLPLPGASNVSLTPTLEWNHLLSQLATFRVQIATAQNFVPASIVLDVGGINASSTYTVPVSTLSPQTQYYWRVNATVLLGISLVTSPFSTATSFTTGTLTNITQNGTGIPEEYKLHRNYPNPFNPSTNIKFDVKDAGFTRLKVYNMLGQEIASLVNQNLDPGKYEVTFDAAGLSSGVYVINFSVNSHNSSMKVALNK